MMNHGIDCATAMKLSFQLAQDRVRRIRALENRQPEDTSKSDEVRKLLTDVFIDGCKDVAMGLIHWRSVYTFLFY